MAELDNSATVDDTSQNGSGTVNPALTGNESATTATGETSADTDQQPDKGKPDPGVQKAIDRQRRLRGEAERRAARAEGELEAYRRLGTAPASTPKAAAGSELKASDFATYDDFILARADQRAEARLEEKLKDLRAQGGVQARQAAEEQQTATFLKEGAAQAKAAGIDFEDAWETLRTAPNVSQTVAQFLYDADHKALLSAHLAENPDELARLSDLHPLAAFKALTKLETQLGSKATPRSTNAPPPPPTLGGRSTPQVDTAQLAKKGDMDGYAKARGFTRK